ncbi:MAG: ImmA/IrrE family metallo-endopeptidase [Acidobacteriota bacterium]
MTPSEQLASLLLARLGVRGKPDLQVIADRIGLRIREVDVDGFDGTLVRALDGAKGVIGVKRSMRENTRKRFTIAHEMGHYLIPSHRTRENVCSTKMIESWQPGLDSEELEANEFAAALLLPASLVRQPLGLSEPSLPRISRAAADFEASLTATTLRFLALTDLSCAMIWSEDGQARWWKASEAFPFFLPKGVLPARTSFAGKLFAGETAPNEFSPINPALWLKSRDVERVGLLLEHSVLLEDDGAAFTLLWADSGRRVVDLEGDDS